MYTVKLVSLNAGKLQDLFCDYRLLERFLTVVRVLLAITHGYSGLADVTAQIVLVSVIGECIE